MKLSRIIVGSSLGMVSVVIYGYTIYCASKFFRGYTYIDKIWLLLGVISIMLIGIGLIYLLFDTYYRITNRHKNAERVARDMQREKKIEEQKNTKILDKEEGGDQRKKDKKIQKIYQKIFAQYKESLTPSEYKKFSEITKYDILLYDALMVSRDKGGNLLKKIELEKGQIYADALKKMTE